MEKFYVKIRKIFYWILGAVIHAGVAVILLALGLGIFYWLVEYSCKVLGCSSGANWLLHAPTGILMSAGVVIGVYLQFKEPIDISKNET